MPLTLSGTSGVLDNSGAFIAGTALASTSGTSIDFTSIPSWVKRVTVSFNGVSTNGSANFLIQIGAGSVTSSGYVSTGNAYNQSSGTTGSSNTTGFLMLYGNGAVTSSGIVTLCLVSSNIWVCSHNINIGTTYVGNGAGSVSLSGTLDRVRVTTTNGTDTFDAGSINILYE